MGDKWGDKWPYKTVEKISKKVAMGPFGSSIKVSTFVDEGVPVISGQHLHGFRLDDTPGYKFITEDHANKLKNTNAFKGDIVFTHAGNIGQVAYIPASSIFDRYVLSQRQFYMRCDVSQAIPEFVTYYFHSPEGRHKLLANASQVGVPSISRPVSNLKTITIPVPPISEQRAIAHILGSLDDKIELNRQMAQTLESIARAIFKSWFVDFDPVKAKMEGKQPEGMTEEIAALFPDRLVDSELGMIPEGWEVLKFPEEFDFTMGQSPPGSSYNEYFNGVPFYQGSADFGQWYPTERIYCTAPTRFANKGDVLFSVRAPVGDMNIALSDCAIGRGLCCIRHKSGSTALTYLYLTNTKSVMEHNAGEGAVFKSLSKKQLTMLPVVSIPDVIAKSFIKIVDPIFEKIQSLEDNARTLCSLRDTLLPRLISGKIRLKQPEDAAA